MQRPGSKFDRRYRRRKVNRWGCNGQSPGPTMEVVAGEPVRIFFTNRLPEHTTIHPLASTWRIFTAKDKAVRDKANVGDTIRFMVTDIQPAR